METGKGISRVAQCRGGFPPYRYPLDFFLLSIGWSWFFWGIAIWKQIPFGSIEGSILIGLGGIGPSASALGLLFLIEPTHTRLDFYKRLWNWDAIPWKVWVFVLGFPLGLQLLSILLSLPWGGSRDQFLLAPSLTGLPQALYFGLFVLLFGPLPEELGWRGYALPGLLTRMSGVSASILLASFWALWHFPLFLIPGYPLGALLEEPLRIVFYLLDFFPNTILYTMVFLNSGGSIPAAILFHWSGNFWGMAFETGQAAEGIALVLKANAVIVALLSSVSFEESQRTRRSGCTIVEVSSTDSPGSPKRTSKGAMKSLQGFPRRNTPI